MIMVLLTNANCIKFCKSSASITSLRKRTNFPHSIGSTIPDTQPIVPTQSSLANFLMELKETVVTALTKAFLVKFLKPNA